VSDIVINQGIIASTSVTDTTRRSYGSTIALASMLTDAHRKLRYFVIEEVNGGVQLKFTNTNPEPEQPR